MCLFGVLFAHTQSHLCSKVWCTGHVYTLICETVLVILQVMCVCYVTKGSSCNKIQSLPQSYVNYRDVQCTPVSHFIR